jgi:hypothetical protein
MKVGRMVLALMAVSICPATLANSPFDGLWTLNVEASQLAPVKISWAEAGTGRLKFTSRTQSYTFNTDGQAFRTPMGDEQTFEEIGHNAHRIITKRNGAVLLTQIFKLSPDGNNLSIDADGIRPNGTPFSDQEKYVRTSAGTGLVGNWQSIMTRRLPHDTLKIETSGKEDVSLALSSSKSLVHGKWNGWDYPFQGPTVPAGTTVSVSNTGADAFTLIQKFNAKVVTVLRFKLAPDGKSMVADGTDGQGRELFKEVWDK